MTTDNNTWKGYSIDEIRIRRVMNLAKMEIEKSRLKTASQPITDKKSLFGASPMIKKMVGALDLVDYAVIAFTLGSKLIKIFRKTKK